MFKRGVKCLAFELAFINSSLIQRQAVNEILVCNDLTINYGLVLTREQAIELVETRNHSLNANGRIEFGGGIIDKIIKEFCDSPYLSIHNYAETLHELIEIFYYYKNETLDLMSDDDLIKYMKNSFDEVCQGSLELLAGRELYRLSKNIIYGRDPYLDEDTNSECEEDGYE
jgi:hypothetical protein